MYNGGTDSFVGQVAKLAVWPKSRDEDPDSTPRINLAFYTLFLIRVAKTKYTPGSVKRRLEGKWVEGRDGMGRAGPWRTGPRY